MPAFVTGTRRDIVKLWRNLRIRKKIIISIVFTSLALISILTVSSILSFHRIGTDALKGKGGVLAIITAESVKAPVQYNIREDVDKVLEQLISNDSDVSVVAAIVQKPAGEFVVITHKTDKKNVGIQLEQTLKKLAVRPPAKKGNVVIMDGGNLQFVAVNMDLTANDAFRNGYLLLGLNTTRNIRDLEMSIVIMLGLGLCMLFIGSLLAFFISNSITNPLKEAVQVANALAEGNLSVEVIVRSEDETGQMMSALGNMVRNLREVISRTVAISSGIASASGQLLQTSEKIATGMEEVSQQANSVSVASEEMSATSGEIARNCENMASASEHTSTTASAGAVVVTETINGMMVISEHGRQTSKTIEALGASSEKIGDIVSTIEDIADQTNLLSLNAAIEAARAGEQGRGFAVVADEVRTLAERTTRATRDISTLIKAIQKENSATVVAMKNWVTEVEQGVTSSHKSGHALEDILKQINEVSMQVNQIATAASQQSYTTSEVTKNIQQINEVVNDTASGAMETADAASLLVDQAKELQQLVGRFRLT